MPTVVLVGLDLLFDWLFAAQLVVSIVLASFFLVIWYVILFNLIIFKFHQLTILLLLCFKSSNWRGVNCRIFSRLIDLRRHFSSQIICRNWLEYRLTIEYRRLFTIRSLKWITLLAVKIISTSSVLVLNSRWKAIGILVNRYFETRRCLRVATFWP